MSAMSAVSGARLRLAGKLALLCCLGGVDLSAAGRIVVPFGQGWRYHLGDAPDGPSYGSGALSTFIPRARCAPMASHKEWTPGGNKDAGQPYTPCAIACSYDPSCTAYDDGGGPGGIRECLFGNSSTICTALTPTPAPTPVPRGKCAVTLQKQLSATACVEGESFGCVEGYEAMYATGGCRGDFDCNGKKVLCQSCGAARVNCTCGDGAGHGTGNGNGHGHGVATHDSRAPAPTAVMQRPNVSEPYADFQRNFSFAARGFNDDKWARTSLPHDCLFNQSFDPNAGDGAAFLPRTVVWYRKNFALPESLRGQHIELYLQGAFQYAEIYVNGVHVLDHSVGYTTFTARLDNVSSLVYQSEGSAAAVNVIAVRVDPTFGSGHWYEGGGINRPLSLVVSPLGPRFVQNGVFANPNSDGTTLRVSAEIEDLSNESEGADQDSVPPPGVNFTLRDESGSVVARASAGTGTGSGPGPDPMTAPPSPGVVRAVLTPGSKLQAWSPQTPVTYELTAEVGADSVTITTGVRVFDWNRSKARLNGHTIELQGFSHHPSFAGMGAMTSPRLALFMAQTTKALGMNFWRNSHNPYEDAVYQILTEIGVMNWDENRQLGSDHVMEYHDMIKAHRNHAAVMLYGICNEAMCGVESGAAAEAFLKLKNSLDPERPQNGNHVSDQEYNFPFCDILTESGSANLNEWHAQYPNKPISTGEHGFGNSHLLDSRSPLDVGLDRLGNVSVVFSGALAPDGKGWGNLKPKQTVPFLLSSHGLGMWAMADYLGEAFEGWPTFVKSRGHLDLAGFPRSTAWWFRTNYLANTENVPLYQKPLIKGTAWQTAVRVITPCQIFASTPKIEVLVDGTSKGVFNVSRDYGLVDLRQVAPPRPGPSPCSVRLIRELDSESAACVRNTSYDCTDGSNSMWVQGGCRGLFSCNGRNTTCECEGAQGFCSTRHQCSCDQPLCEVHGRNVTAVGLDESGSTVLGEPHSLLVPERAAKLELVVDVPSKSTGTGEALYLDGSDVAFVRAQLVDAAGTVVRTEDQNVTFSVERGPIRIVGVGSGNIRNHQPPLGNVYETWQGLARVVVQATTDCTGEHRDLAEAIDVDAPPGTYAAECPTAGPPAVLAAKTSTGLAATISIPLSGDESDSVLAVARRNRELDYSYLDLVQP